ncbi:hypothetical protein EXIGLDRAFT_730625, partial [Exidia glandulosa HHB12029]
MAQHRMVFLCCGQPHIPASLPGNGQQQTHLQALVHSVTLAWQCHDPDADHVAVLLQYKVTRAHV